MLAFQSIRILSLVGKLLDTREQMVVVVDGRMVCIRLMLRSTLELHTVVDQIAVQKMLMARKKAE